MRLTIAEEIEEFLGHAVMYMGDNEDYWYFLDEIMECFIRINKVSEEVEERLFGEPDIWELLGIL